MIKHIIKRSVQCYLTNSNKNFREDIAFNVNNSNYDDWKNKRQKTTADKIILKKKKNTKIMWLKHYQIIELKKNIIQILNL